MPDELVPYALELRDAHEAVEHARQHASRDELDGGLWDRLREDAFHAARAFVVELYRWQGRDVSWRERQLEQWLEWRAVEEAVTHAERVAAVTAPEPEPEIPDAILAEIDNRHQQRQALGRPSEAHRRWSELLGGRTL